MDKYIKIKKMN